VPEAEPEAHAHRSLALGHELSRGVVDGGDVVGVERVPQAQGVRGDTQSDAEELTGDLVLLRRHERDQRAPTDQVEQDDEAGHPYD
jgi:hypothetical protein